MNNICNLLNSVHEITAIMELNKMNQTKQEVFQNPRVFEHILLMLEVYRFRPRVRKMIFKQFETLLFANGVLPEPAYKL